MEKAVAFRTLVLMNGTDRDHPTEDALERFLLQRSEEEELEIVETHILACDLCVTRLETLEFNIEATKLALQSFQEPEREAELTPAHSNPLEAGSLAGGIGKRDQFVPDSGKQKVAARVASWTAAFSSWFTLPKLSFAGAGLAACALAATFISVPRDVNITAYRDSEASVVSQWVPLDFHLNARDLPAGPVKVEIVDNQGGPIWQGSAMVLNNEIDVKAPRLKTAGQYLLRVYAGENPNNLLREFSLQTKPLF